MTDSTAPQVTTDEERAALARYERWVRFKKNRGKSFAEFMGRTKPGASLPVPRQFEDSLSPSQRAEFSKRISHHMRKVKLDADPSLIRPMVRIHVMLEFRLEEEMSRAVVDSRTIKELHSSLMSSAEQLGITPKERRLAGKKSDETMSQALAKASEAATKAMANRAARDAENEALFDHKTPHEP